MAELVKDCINCGETLPVSCFYSESDLCEDCFEKELPAHGNVRASIQLDDNYAIRYDEDTMDGITTHCITIDQVDPVIFLEFTKKSQLIAFAHELLGKVGV